MQKLLHNAVVSICGCWWSRNYGLLQLPDDGESPHHWSGTAVVCWAQWVTLTQILFSLTGHLQTWKPRHFADSVSVQNKLKSHAGSIVQPKASDRNQRWYSEHTDILYKVSLKRGKPIFYLHHKCTSCCVIQHRYCYLSQSWPQREGLTLPRGS